MVDATSRQGTTGGERPVLAGLRARFLGWRAAGAVLALSATLLALGLAFFLLDTALDLAESTRRAAPWVVGVMALLGAGLLGGRGRRYTTWFLARTLERADGSLGSRLANAVQLEGQAAASPVAEWLRREAVESGRRAAARLAVWPVVRWPVRITALAVLAVLGAWLGMASWSPDWLGAVGPRFADPGGDHPPYSRVRITASPGRAEVTYGGQMEIRAQVSGAPVDRLWVVTRSTTNETRTMMFLAPDRSYFQTLANLREPTEYWVTDGRARTHRYGIGIRYTPQIARVEVRAEYPEYTGLPVRTQPLGTEPQAYPAGTRLGFRVFSNRPLHDGTLMLTPVLGGQAVPLGLAPETNAQVVAGQFVLTQAVTFALAVRDVRLLESAEPKRGRFQVTPDTRPRLHVLEPGRDAVATPAFRVPVRVRAEDDFGVAQVVWLRGFNRSVERPFTMILTSKDGARAVESTGAFDLGLLGVRAGDVIEYYFEAVDNDPAGPNLALSRMYRLEVIAEEQYAQVLRQAAAQRALFEPYFQLGAWLKRLAERARRLDAATSSADAAKAAELSAESRALAEELDQYLAELGKLLKTPEMFDVEEAFRRALVAQHTSLDLARVKFRQATGGGGSQAEARRQLREALERLAQTEQAEVSGPATQIAAVAQLLARADSFVQLAREQALLARMLQRFTGSTNTFTRAEQMELRELAERQQKVREALTKWNQALPELVGQLPADPQYDRLREDVGAFLDAVAEAKIDDDLGDAGRALGELDAMTGHALAQLAATKMDQLIARCEGTQQTGEACLRFQPSMQQALGGSLGQILAAMGAGNEGAGRDGYSMFQNDIGLYGPNRELAGDPNARAAGRGTGASARGRADVEPEGSGEAVTGPAADGARVRLQTEARFPIRYRELVGEYFRSIAESPDEGKAP